MSRRSKPDKCPWATCVLSFAIGALHGRAAEAFGEHLALCETCSARLAQLRDVLERYIPEPEPPRGGDGDDDWSDERSARIQRKIFERIRAELRKFDD